MNYISLKELAEKWDISIKYLQTLARTGMLEGAIKQDHKWMVPEDIKRPTDHRVRTGAYKDWRKRYNVRKFKIDEKFLKWGYKGNFDTDAECPTDSTVDAGSSTKQDSEKSSSGWIFSNN